MSIADIYAKKNDDDLADDLAYFACEGGGTEGSRSAMFEAARRLRDRPAPTPQSSADDFAERLESYAFAQPDPAGYLGAMLFDAAGRLRDRPAPAPPTADAFDAAQELTEKARSRHRLMTLCKVASEAARDGRDPIETALRLAGLAAIFGIDAGQAARQIRSGWDSGLKARAEGGGS